MANYFIYSKIQPFQNLLFSKKKEHTTQKKYNEIEKDEFDISQKHVMLPFLKMSNGNRKRKQDEKGRKQKRGKNSIKTIAKTFGIFDIELFVYLFLIVGFKFSFVYSFKKR